MQNSEEYNNKGGCKNKKVSAKAPSLVEARPHHMCLARYFARVLAAERRKDEKCTLAQLLRVFSGGAFSGGLYFPTVHPNVHPNVHRNVHLGWTLRWTLGWTLGWTVGPGHRKRIFSQQVREKWIPDALIFPKGACKVAVIFDLNIRMKSRLRRRLRRRLRLWLRPVAYAPVGFRTCRAFPAPAGQFSGQL